MKGLDPRFTDLSYYILKCTAQIWEGHVITARDWHYGDNLTKLLAERGIFKADCRGYDPKGYEITHIYENGVVTPQYNFISQRFQARLAQVGRDEVIAINQDLLNRCLEFGFQNDTDEINNCVAQLRLATEQAEIIRSQAASIDAARRAEQTEREAAERQRAFGRALIGIGAGISSGRGIMPTAPANSGNMFQTCNYNVLGEIVPYATSSARICPMSMDFGGVRGTLQ